MNTDPTPAAIVWISTTCEGHRIVAIAPNTGTRPAQVDFSFSRALIQSSMSVSKKNPGTEPGQKGPLRLQRSPRIEIQLRILHDIGLAEEQTAF